MNNADQDVQQPRQSKNYTLRYCDAAGAYGAAEASGSIRYPCSRDEAIDAIGAHAAEALGGPVRLDVRGDGTDTPVSVVWGVVATLDPGADDDAINLAEAVQEFNAATFLSDAAEATGRVASTPLRDCEWLRERLESGVLALPPDGALIEQVRSYTVYDELPPSDQLEPGASMTGISGSLDVPIRGTRETAGSASALHHPGPLATAHLVARQLDALPVFTKEEAEAAAVRMRAEFSAACEGATAAADSFSTALRNDFPDWPPKFHTGGTVDPRKVFIGVDYGAPGGDSAVLVFTYTPGNSMGKATHQIVRLTQAVERSDCMFAALTKAQIRFGSLLPKPRKPKPVMTRKGRTRRRVRLDRRGF